MSILVSQKILNRIHEELSRSTESFLLVSAYCKLPLVKYFDQCITSSEIEKKLIVRFRPEDISSGASDLEIYPYCKENGWKLYFRLDLHAKTYVFDRLRCIVGSANATGSGMSIGGFGNYEMATACELSPNDLRTIDTLLLGAVEMNDNVYQIMKDTLNMQSAHSTNNSKWPKELLDMFVPDYSLLFAEDFPTCVHVADASCEDMMFLNMLPGADITEIKDAFKNAKCYQWFVNLVKNQENQEIYWGAVAANLHNTILNDPKPFRKDVKQLLVNLLSWIEELKMDDVIVDRPNHSQRIRYIKEDTNNG